MKRARVDRRRVLAVSAAAAATGLAGTMSRASAQGIPARFQEAPSLAALTRGGRLPAVTQRLPQEPVVIVPVENIGVYGGTWRTGMLGPADAPLLTRTINYENLVRWDVAWTTILPNVAKSWDANATGSEYTFKLRPGLKWSDGQPFTTDDLMFWYQDVALNKALNPLFPSWAVVAGQPVRTEKIDANTVKFSFAEPYGLFLQFLATPVAGSTGAVTSGMIIPAHYLKQWHIDHNRAAVEDAVRREQVADWAALWTIKSDPWKNPDLPTLHAWQVKTPVGAGTRVVFERNPYYWKVDTEGNQLPYIDQVVAEMHQSADTMVLKALNGEIDMQERTIATNQNKSVFFDGQQRGNYHFFETSPATNNSSVMAVNMTQRDPQKRQIFSDVRFRAALSLAMDRQTLIDTVFVGQGVPRQPAPLENSPYFHQRLAYQYTEYSPSRANALLDEMGLTSRDSRGMRLQLDGQPLHIGFEYAIGVFTPWADLLQLMKQQWAAVGIDMDLVPEERSFWSTRAKANEHDATIWTGGDGLADSLLNPWSYLPLDPGDLNFYGAPWGQWYLSSGAQGEEPPASMRRQFDLYETIKATVNPDEQKRLFAAILDIAADEFRVMGISSPVPGYGIQRNDFLNVPRSMPSSFRYPTPAPTNPAQYFTIRRG